MCQSHEKLDTTFDLEMALKYITKAKMIKADNKAIVSKFKIIKKLLREQNKKDKKQFNGLFQRGSIYDDKEIVIESENNNDDSAKLSSKNIMCQKYILGICFVILFGLWYLFIFKTF